MTPLKGDDKVFGCGFSKGLGIFETDISTKKPVELTTFRKVGIQKICSSLHSCALTKDGKVYCWGDSKYRNIIQTRVDDYGQCGTGSTSKYAPITLLKLPFKVRDVAVSYETTLLCSGMSKFSIFSHF